jgi:hypothetical protein
VTGGAYEATTLEFPDLAERFGERVVADAAHVLDRDIPQAQPYDVEDLTFRSRLRGLETPAEIAVYKAVEKRTLERAHVLETIAERESELAEKGFRPDSIEAALFDPDTQLPERYVPAIPLWVSTSSLREVERPERERLETSGSFGSSYDGPEDPAERTTQATLAADGGVSNE